jgi:pimeloyl-ACP methyl ester carboxylesterase
LAPGIRSVWGRDGGLVLRALRAGAGPSLVLLASPLVTADTYRPTLRELAHAFDAAVLELPGSGRSCQVRRSPSPAAHARAALAFAEAAGLLPAVVVGHSNSAPAAIELALLAPERVTALVLVDAVGAGGPDRLSRALAGRARDAIREPLFTVRAAPHVARNLLVHPRAFLAQVREAAAADLGSRASALRVPTLLAWGARDATVPPDRAHVLQRLVPGAALATGPGGHDWLVTRPRAFRDALTMFLAVRRAYLVVTARRRDAGRWFPTSPAAPPS